MQEYYIEKRNKPKNEESLKATTLSTGRVNTIIGCELYDVPYIEPARII